jgi:asparagine synthase (glutamine-hydrolysing)
MCGIWCCIGKTASAATCIKKLEARGPEGTRLLDLSNCTLGFTRLAINGLNEAGMQPMRRDGLSWICNGEIYNWRELAAQYGLSNTSGSDCEILGELYEIFCQQDIPLKEFFRALDGVFAIIIVDDKRSQIVVGRDPYGVRPLYWGDGHDGLFFGSEMKSLVPVCDRIEPFLPGHYQLISDGDVAQISYHTVPFLKNPLLTDEETACAGVRLALVSAVRKRLMTERPVAALLSGGVDSSLIAALVAKELRAAGAPPLETYSIGMAGSQDLFYAAKVAKWIGSKHTEIVMTAEEFFEAIPAVIRDIESFDTTTVRASVGNWLVARAIALRSEAKVVFNGDGADEIWGSYLYFYGAPSDHAFEAESSRLLEDIHMFDVLRSDRSISSHGLEPRTPFLDKQFVAVARSVATNLRRPVKGVRPEKWLMRKAFDALGLLPKEVLWRQKEAFSDGVSGEKSWYQICQEMTAAKVAEVPEGTTAEKIYYRQIFDQLYGAKNAEVNVPYFWMPRWSTATDPSARTLAVYS